MRPGPWEGPPRTEIRGTRLARSTRLRTHCRRAIPSCPQAASDRVLPSSHEGDWPRRWRLFGQGRLALVHEQGSAFRCDLHEGLPGEATGPNVTVFPAAHGGERHPECLREVFL